MIDFHCHLDLYSNPAKIAEDCRLIGLSVLSVTTTPSACEGTYSLGGDSEQINTALGLHPQLAHERHRELPIFDELLPAVRFVGEIGLDGAPEFRKTWHSQVAVFEHILAACSHVGGRIMSLHSRRASEEVLNLIQDFPAAGIPILHWFSGSFYELDRAIKLGCWFSVGPAMLQSKKGRSISERLPRERILTESDGPFTQVRGKPLMPWDVELAIAELSKIWSLEFDDVSKVLDGNLATLLNEDSLKSGPTPNNATI